jgi:hypothetical protein
MDQANQPLSRRLRDAAIERTATESERVDDFVLDRDGVIDLRELDRDELGASIADPAKALATIRGRLGDAHEVSGLYDESEPPRSRWRLGLRARHAFGGDVESPSDSGPASATAVETIERPTVDDDDDVDDTAATPTPLPPLSRLSLVPLADETDASDTDVIEATDDHTDADTDDPVTVIDLSDGDRPTATCPKCMGLGHRDLFDRFSQVEFYSCDNCMHMWQQDRS